MEKIEVTGQAPVAPAIQIDMAAALAPTTPTPEAAPIPEAVIPATEPAAQPAPAVVPEEVNELHIKPVAPTAEEVAAIAATVEKEKAENEEISGQEIASIKSAYWGAFHTLISLVSPDLGSADIISIVDGKLTLSKDGGVLSADLTDLFGKNSWHILGPKEVIKTLKLIKGGTKVTIMDDGPRNIVYNSDGDIVKTVVTVTKPETTNVMKVEEVDPGDFKVRKELSNEMVGNLVAAKAAHGALYYNIIIDVDTHEILSIDVDSKFKENILSATGRTTERYKVKDLFPIPKPDNMLIEVYNKGGQIYIKTLADLTMTTVNFQIPAMKFAQNAAYEY